MRLLVKQRWVAVMQVRNRSRARLDGGGGSFSDSQALVERITEGTNTWPIDSSNKLDALNTVISRTAASRFN